jgi:hypothetical protein
VFTNTCADVCSADTDCATSHADFDFAADLQCQNNGTCDFQHCAGDANCRPGTVCYEGDCVSPADCSQVTSCSVVPASVVTQQGTQVSLSATAFLTSSALAPGASFTWASDDDTIASVAGGSVTGGASTGNTLITAKVAGCDAIACSADVRNYGAVAAGARVVVIDELTGAPMEGVTVDIEGVGSVDTDATGVATFAAADLTAASATVTISAANIGYVSFLAADSNDLIAHVGVLPDPTKAGGYRGQFDFSKVICEPGKPCEVKLGFTGASIPGKLFNLNLDSLIGERILTHFELGGTSEDIGLPGGLVLGLNDTWFRQSYEATGTAGTRVAWGLGGKLNLADLTEPLGMLFADEDHALSVILSLMLPLVSELFTSLVPNVDIVPRAKVADVDDINGDGDTTDLVPDFANFPALPGGDMVFKVPMDQTMAITVPALPSDGAGGFLFDGVIVLAGVLVRDAGLVPLGLSAGLDAGSPDGPPDGQIADITLSTSDVAGRLPEGSYRRFVIAVALNIAKLRDPDNTDPTVIAGQVRFVDSFDGSLTLNGPMSPAVFTYYPLSRQVDLTDLPAGADTVVLLASSAAGTWQIFHPAVTGLIDLPAAPAAGDRSDRLNLAALKFAGAMTYSDLIAFNDTNLDDLVSLVSEFVVVYPSGQRPTIGCSTGGRASGAWAWLGLVALALSSAARRSRGPG